MREGIFCNFQIVRGQSVICKSLRGDFGNFKQIWSLSICMALMSDTGANGFHFTIVEFYFCTRIFKFSHGFYFYTPVSHRHESWYAYDPYSWTKTSKKCFLHDSWSIIHGVLMVDLLFKWQAKTSVTSLSLSLPPSYCFASW